MNKILPIWQPVGYSTYQITNALAQYFNVKASHTGVLDPLAEGVIIVLLGEERLNKNKYADWKKEYEFEVVFGIKTDSYDGMGLITEISSTYKQFELSQIKDVLNSFIGEYIQEVPLYSAVKLNGKKLFLYAKNKIEVLPLPTKKGEIYNIELLNVKNIFLNELAIKMCENINKIISGEFRQTETYAGWKKIFNECSNQNSKFMVAKIKVLISRGMYIRSLSQDICKRLNTVGFVSSLIRTQNGDYTVADCEKLENIFGESFDKKLFVSKFES